jgi:hypothetical protein
VVALHTHENNRIIGTDIRNSAGGEAGGIFCWRLSRCCDDHRLLEYDTV